MRHAVIAAVVAAVALLNSPAALLAQDRPPTKISADLAALPARQAVGMAAAPTPAAPMAGGWAVTTEAFMPVRGDWVTIDAVATGDPQTLAAELIALGARNVAVAGRLVSGEFAIAAIPSLEALPSLTFARPAYRLSRAGAITSQGDGAMRSNLTRNTFGIDGSGVTVGVLSNSFNCLGGAPSDTVSGDLPATVTVVQESFSDCTDEGRAMLQIVHDIAPGASLAFATADGGQANFATNIRALQTAGAKVIVDDTIHLNEPMFQDGVVAQAVDEVVAAGASYFSAAGNEGRHGYTQAFIPGTLPTNFIPHPAFLGGTPHKFGSTSLQSVSVPGQSDLIVVLQWDSPFASVSGPPGAQNALDFYLLAPDGLGHLILVAAATSDSVTSGDPVTLFGIGCFAPPGARCTGFIMIVNRTGPNPGRFKYVVFPSGGNPITSPALNSGTIYGHANAAGAMAVGASFFNTPLTLESYSSAGTTPILFDADGNAVLDPRAFKPDFVAPDGGDTTFFGFDTDGNGFPNFFGTSAAAPHAAAVAALMLEAEPTLTPEEVRATLRQTAINMGAVGFDTSSGFGFIQADRALNGLHQFVITAGPTAAPTSVSPVGPVSLSVTATDNFGHTLTYVWSALCTGLTSNGSFDDATAQAPTWTAPANTTGAAKTCAIKVIVSDGHGFTKTGSITETVRSAPKITLLTPAIGPVGTVVTITGLSLGNVTDVAFTPLGVTFPATNVTATSVRVTVPAGAQTGVVRLTSADGTGTSPGVFKLTPKVTDFTPTAGIAGESVTINGFNLQVGSATPTVKFGTGAATVTSATPTSIDATILATSLTGKISVTTADGTGMSATDFFVTKPPTIIGFTPVAGPVGTILAVTGSNLNAVTEVRLNGVAVPSFDHLTATSLRVVIPTGATTGKFGVTNAAGSALSAGIFKVAPKIDSFTPLSALPGASMTISGSNLKVGAVNPTVRIGAVVAPVTASTDTSVTITVPATAVTGKMSVLTTDGTGMSATNFIVIKPPTITGFTPASAPRSTIVTITGTNLNSVTEVRLNDVTVPSFSIATATSLLVPIPAGATTGKFGVTNAAGSALSAGIFKVAPKITNFAPMGGIAGDQVMINGFNLQGSATPIVKFGAGPGTVISATPTSIVAAIGATSLTGKISVTTTDGTGMSATDFIVIKPPTITGVTPAAGPVGTTVTITGTNLNSTTEVRLNDVALPSFSILTATSLRGVIPAGVTTGKFGVTNAAGSALSAGIFKVMPKITDFTPASGLTGNQVTINGFNLHVGSSTPTVKLGAGPAEVISATPTSIVAAILETSLRGKISVTTTDGTGVSATDFLVVKPPTITAFTPASGPVGTTVTITGTNLDSVIEVTMNDLTLPDFTVLGATSLRVAIPAGAMTGQLAVRNMAAGTLSAGIFKVTPKIDSFTPITGSARTDVTITGSNLTIGLANPTVKIGAVVAPLTLGATDTSVTITVPAAAVTGKISVTTSAGTGISTDNFVVFKPPTVTAVTPTSGQVGALVTITGTNLSTVTNVTFNGIDAPSFTIVSATSIKVNVPAGASTGKIAVTNPAATGQSAGNFTVLP
jgi:hypothetical protein